MREGSKTTGSWGASPDCPDWVGAVGKIRARIEGGCTDEQYAAFILCDKSR